MSTRVVVERNERFCAARERTPSRRTPGACVGRQELAELVNAWLYQHRGLMVELDSNYIGKLERGRIRWPRESYRAALRSVLGVVNDAQLGFYDTRRMPAGTTPAERKRYLQRAAAAGQVGVPWPVSGGIADPSAVGPVGRDSAVAGEATELIGAAKRAASRDIDPPGAGQPAPAPLAPVPVVPLPGLEGRVVLHWTGRKAYALRIAMRLSVREFAAKLGVAHSVVGRWQPAATARPGQHVQQLLDTMLSLATDEEVFRFGLALRELGEHR